MRFLSIGEFCFASHILRSILKVKTESYPFDWVFSDVPCVTNCVRDNFKELLGLLDQGNGEIMNERIRYLIAHRDITKEEDVSYHKRCIQRFLRLFEAKDEPIVFLHVPNNNTEEENTRVTDMHIMHLNRLAEALIEKQMHNFQIITLQIREGNGNYILTQQQHVQVLTIFAKEPSKLSTWIDHINKQRALIRRVFTDLDLLDAE